MNSKEKRGDVRGESENAAGSDCGCGAGGCGKPRVGRREFMKIAGLGMLATSAGRPLTAMAGPFAAPDTPGHNVPGDKKLAPEWMRALYERGVKESYRGADLEAIGMPCGGIGSGQMYLCGDGTLGCWQIFNNAESLWVADTNATYLRRPPAKPVFQRFVLSVREEGKPGTALPLDGAGFPGVEFQGEYPIARIRYKNETAPVAVELEAFSPFIPLNAADSALPATLFNFTVTNPATAAGAVVVSLAGLLENPVGLHNGGPFRALRRARFMAEPGRALLLHSAEMEPEPETPAAAPAPPREPVLFADFEGKDYGDWAVEGTAFGEKPAGGTLPGQQSVTGFQGEGLVNSFLGGDGPTGKLISPAFTVDRHFVNFLIGGGAHAEKTCMNLVVDGEAVRTAKGFNIETLAWQHWDVSQLEGREARIEIVDDASGGWGHINVDHITFADEPADGELKPFDQMPDFGTMALALAADAAPAGDAAGLQLPEGLEIPGGAPLTADAAWPVRERRTGLLSTAPVALAPGGSVSFSFVVAWHFPNQAHGHHYAARFNDAAEVARHLLDNRKQLARDTRLWRDAYYDSTLPYWLLDRLLSTVSTLSTGTCQWWKNGRFYAYEGVTCCEGTCTHVWNYSHTEARLFPELTRSVREMQDFHDVADGGGFNPETGLVGFRSNANYAADGQCGTILKAHREHLMAADDAFLKRNWPRIKKAMEYSIAQDENGDGLIENSQHNTFDINFYGANTFVGSLYLCALRAAEEMAREAGDDKFARHVHGIFEKGRKNTEKRLWNGEYFVQDVDLQKHPEHQYKNGCLSDQLFGQGWAHQLGLGYLYDPDKVRSALRAVWKYNWAPDVAPYNEKHPPFRWFISPGQAGLFTCTWPHDPHLDKGVLYREEVWTGIEYQVAGHMAAEGMPDEALAICRAVHDRYQPGLFNPYNEIECGDHYARAMASWGVYLSLAGFYYHGPKGILGFNPRISPDHYKALFTTAEGWIDFEQERKDGVQTNRIRVVWGKLRLQTLRLGLEGKKPGNVSVMAGGTEITANTHTKDGNLVVEFSEVLALHEGGELTVTVGR